MDSFEAMIQRAAELAAEKAVRAVLTERGLMQPKRYYRPMEAAAYLGINHYDLRKATKAGNGPPCIRKGPRTIIYDVQELDRWMKEGGNVRA